MPSTRPPCATADATKAAPGCGPITIRTITPPLSPTRPATGSRRSVTCLSPVASVARCFHGWRVAVVFLALSPLLDKGLLVGRPGRGWQCGPATSLGSGAPPGALGPLRGLPSLQLAVPHCQPRPGLTTVACGDPL